MSAQEPTPFLSLFLPGASPRPLTEEERGILRRLRDPETLARAGAILAAAQKRWLRERNQFVVVEKEAEAELVGLFCGSLRRLADAPDLPAEELALVEGELASWMGRWLGGPPPAVPCAEYSPGLQLELLGLDEGRILSPVLDLGCGGGMALVHHLRKQDVEAYGVDPAASGPWAVGSDWLEFSFGAMRWGTVVSHQGFSLHFLHHHFRPGSVAPRMAAKAMEILRSLRSGGAFHYVPSLPFFEDLLPRQAFDVERLPLPASLRSGFAWVEEVAPGMEVASATIVRKR